MNSIDAVNLCINGLSLGDAFGEKLMRLHDTISIISRKTPPPEWSYTDDTQMALVIASVLIEKGFIDENYLALKFADNYEFKRGYGGNTLQILSKIRRGEDWKTASESAFDGKGSFGNGAAMRVAPVGAYFVDNVEDIIINSRKSCRVTHSHIEAEAGAIAVALAAAYSLKSQGKKEFKMSDFFDFIIPHVPKSETRNRIIHASELDKHTQVVDVAKLLGSGQKTSSQDTVPFSLWCSASYINNFEDALWNTSRGLGDMDTTCAIVGGIVALHVGWNGLPLIWLSAREKLPKLPM